MAPMHRAPAGRIGMILEKQMIFPLVDRKAVGVIHPTDGGCDVERRTFLFGNIGAVTLFIVSRFC